MDVTRVKGLGYKGLGKPSGGTTVIYQRQAKPAYNNPYPIPPDPIPPKIFNQYCL
jgi:hypothetical protein